MWTALGRGGAWLGTQSAPEFRVSDRGAPIASRRRASARPAVGVDGRRRSGAPIHGDLAASRRAGFACGRPRHWRRRSHARRPPASRNLVAGDTHTRPHRGLGQNLPMLSMARAGRRCRSWRVARFLVRFVSVARLPAGGTRDRDRAATRPRRESDRLCDNMRRAASPLVTGVSTSWRTARAERAKLVERAFDSLAGFPHRGSRRVVSRRRHRRGHHQIKVCTEDAEARDVDSGGGRDGGGTSRGSGEAKPRNARRFA